jgi:C-7 ketoreductase
MSSTAGGLAEAYRWLGSQVPLGRIGTPEEVALWITLLLSPLASFMTGAVIPLDGVRSLTVSKDEGAW